MKDRMKGGTDKPTNEQMNEWANKQVDEQGSKQTNWPMSKKTNRWAKKWINKQVTRGHNIVADGWAGASNPQPNPNHTPNPPPTHLHTNNTNCSILNTRFFAFSTRAWQLKFDGRTNGPTDQRTDKAFYRVAWAATKNRELWIKIFMKTRSRIFVFFFMIFYLFYGLWVSLECDILEVRQMTTGGSQGQDYEKRWSAWTRSQPVDGLSRKWEPESTANDRKVNSVRMVITDECQNVFRMGF